MDRLSGACLGFHPGPHVVSLGPDSVRCSFSAVLQRQMWAQWSRFILNCQALTCRLTSALINRGPELFVNCLSFQGAQEPSSSPRAPSFQEREACDETSRTNHDPVTYSLIAGEGVTPRLGACAAGLGWVTPAPFLWLALWDGGGYFPFSRGGSVAVLVPRALSGTGLWFGTRSTYPKCDPLSQHPLLQLLPGQG